jgi:glutamine amidotransferase-like uncharacterized protein
MTRVRKYSYEPTFIILFLAGFILVALSVSYVVYFRTTPEDLITESADTLSESLKIALYSDSGASETSVRALEAMFLWMNHTVILVDADHINNNGLSGFSVLCMPGGDMYQYSRSISLRGKENIRVFIRRGGGYIGVCGGAYFASERVVWQGRQLPMTPLRIFPGEAEGPSNDIAPYPNYTVCRCNIVDHSHPITESEPESVWILYCWGPVLKPRADSGVTILGRYEGIDQPSIVVFGYGDGRVFLIGTHPEIEEDSDRDLSDFADECDDRGSDWPLMKKAVNWLLEKR